MTGEEALIEHLAEYAHTTWAGWHDYLLRKCELIEHPWIRGIAPESYPDRWWRQMHTPYCDLSEAEKESDREEARTMLSIVKVHLGLK